jgi:hypothetical protein
MGDSTIGTEDDDDEDEHEHDDESRDKPVSRASTISSRDKVYDPPSLGSYGAPSKVKNKVLWNGLERSEFNIFDMWAN